MGAAAGSIALPAQATPPMAARTRLLLEGPVAPTLLRLAAPNVLVMVLQATVSTLDAVFVGWLGGDALAGVSVVFPLVMLMSTMSAGGMGGGVASAVARALGAGRQKEADALVAHAQDVAEERPPRADPRERQRDEAPARGQVNAEYHAAERK